MKIVLHAVPSLLTSSHAVAQPRGRQKGITFSVAQNLTNRSNDSGSSDVQTSQYFLQATSVSNPRQIDLSLRLRF